MIKIAKALVIFMGLSINNYGTTVIPDIIIDKDTTINGTWNISGSTVVRVINNAQISGNATINGGWWDASYYQSVFDTTITVNILGGAYGIVSTSWYGVATGRADNTRYFQRAIDSRENKVGRLYTPSGTYTILTSLVIQSIYLGDYTGVSLDWYGDYVYNSAVAGTVINYIATGGSFALGIQRGKGVLIAGLAIKGRFVPPSDANPMTYYNITYDNYTDVNGLCNQYYTGVAIDPYVPPFGGVSGSTGVHFSNMYVTGFSTLFSVSQNGATLNGEEIILEKSVLGMCRVVWLSQEPQEKQNVIRNCMAWDRVHTFFVANKSGRGSGNYHIHDINIAGSVIQCFDIVQSGWFGSSIDNIYAENIARIGVLKTSAMVLSLTGSTFQLIPKSIIGVQNIAVTNTNLNTVFGECNFLYYGLPSTEQMLFNGLATFSNYYFSGTYTNQMTGSSFSSNCLFR